MYTVRKVVDFPVPSQDVTHQTLPGGEEFNYSQPGELVNETTAGDGAGLVIGKKTHKKKDRQAGRQVSSLAVRALRQTCRHACMPSWFNVCL
jgi:hypothetical protein